MGQALFEGFIGQYNFPGCQKLESSGCREYDTTVFVIIVRRNLFLEKVNFHLSGFSKFPDYNENVEVFLASTMMRLSNIV